MAMIDEIERLGRMVDQGSMLLDDAADALSISSDGGLTRLGAADLVSGWTSARGQYQRVLDRNWYGLDTISDE